jgi:hypothetical protein
VPASCIARMPSSLDGSGNAQDRHGRRQRLTHSLYDVGTFLPVVQRDDEHVKWLVFYVLQQICIWIKCRAFMAQVLHHVAKRMRLVSLYVEQGNLHDKVHRDQCIQTCRIGMRRTMLLLAMRWSIFAGKTKSR